MILEKSSGSGCSYHHLCQRDGNVSAPLVDPRSIWAENCDYVMQAPPTHVYDAHSIPVERRYPCPAEIIQLLEGSVLDGASALHIKQPESNFIFGVGLGKEVSSSQSV